ncbi:DNA binding HTH domain, Psq-type,Homeobox domain-like,HTH CenpB-type DNA-binding domain,DDE superfamily [Cinara cedri]|uniref:DNA binding HTH domain, Psq-type,Homeobox domain-like,HTH CenpB-type DNA-binding domain,DDE superfamily n=1 Tax=Cinara cedri TaxID=506608 RepID=A0A5E4M5Y9_9HEMI|nr:DNA binding HTH domain, Psq-type,Homeobox domain-like,HTH CenpB-type DNA-binding domain,DDE superfamily [Cinara cedri]
MENKRKLNALTISDKVRLIRLVVKGDRKRCEIAKEYDIPLNTLSSIMKQKDKLLMYNSGNMKKMRTTPFLDIDKCLLKWFTQLQHKSIPVSGTILLKKAYEYAQRLGHTNFKASSGWFTNWKKRHDIVLQKIRNLPDILAGFSPNDIFNINETGLLFKCLPDKTLMFKGKNCSDRKYGKERITIMVGANMSGTEKLKLLVVGKTTKPKCLKGIKSLPIDYKSNKKAWMTSSIFSEWLLHFDRKMKLENRKILLFVDNSTGHSYDIELSSVKVHFLSPNKTSILQPMDQGVIQNFKMFCRKQIIIRLADNIDNNESFSLNILEAIRMSDKAWRSVTPQTIMNCFIKASFKDGVVIPTDDEILSEIIENPSESEDELQREEEVAVVTIQQAKHALRTLRHFVETTASMEDGAFSALSKLEDLVEDRSNKKQTVMTDLKTKI